MIPNHYIPNSYSKGEISFQILKIDSTCLYFLKCAWTFKTMSNISIVCKIVYLYLFKNMLLIVTQSFVIHYTYTIDARRII